MYTFILFVFYFSTECIVQSQSGKLYTYSNVKSKSWLLDKNKTHNKNGFPTDLSGLLSHGLQYIWFIAFYRLCSQPALFHFIDYRYSLMRTYMPAIRQDDTATLFRFMKSHMINLL